MNCIDFRRDALAQPLRLGDLALAHASTCATCAVFHERQVQFDAELFEAMSVPAPDGLAERIVLAQGIRRRKQPWLWGAAAGLVLAAGLATLLPGYLSGNALAAEAIEHVAEEPQSFRLVTRHAAEFLPTELGRQGFRLGAALGEVTYTQLCPMHSGNARHMVVATAQGPVTLLLMPEDARASRRTVRESGGMAAITLPAARGSIAIVASNLQHALADASGAWRTPVAPWSDPKPALDERAFQELFEASLAALPPQQARAFRLREVAGMEVAAVCQEMRITPGGLFELLHLARLQLRRALDRDWFSGAT